MPNQPQRNILDFPKPSIMFLLLTPAPQVYLRLHPLFSLRASPFDQLRTGLPCPVGVPPTALILHPRVRSSADRKPWANFMKPITYRIIAAVFAIGLCSPLLAEEQPAYPRVSLCGQGGSKNPTNRDEYIILVIEGPNLSYETSRIPGTDVVEYVNKLLEVKKVSYIGVYTREGTKYGDVIRAIDILRETQAKNIGISMTEIPVGREP